MSLELRPVVGEWYRRRDRPQPFKLVACDDDSVEVEYFDGTLDEWPLSHWHALDIEPCEAPQDASGPYDDVEQGDEPYSSPPDLDRDDWPDGAEGQPELDEDNEIDR